MLRSWFRSLSLALVLALSSTATAAPNATGPKGGSGGGNGGGGAPASHATSHEDGGADQIQAEQMDTGCLVGEVIGSDGAKTRCQSPAAPGAHAASHQHGGADQVATATPGANVIPKAGAGGTLATGFIPEIALGSGTSGGYASSGTEGGVADEAALTPTDNNDFGGSDPGNADDAINYMAPRVRFALASNNFDAIADITNQVLWRRTKPYGPMTATSFAGNPCRVMQEAINYTLTVTAPADLEYTVGLFGEATVEVASDYFDQGDTRGCIFVIPTSSAPGTGGTGGYSVDDAARSGWPETDTTLVAAGMNNRTATSGTSNTLVDSDGSTLAGENGKYVEIQSGTGAGQKRRISNATSTTLTVDTAWSVTPDATSIYRIYTIPALVSNRVHIVEDYHLIIDQTGQTEVSVFMTRGNGYVAGYDGANEFSLAGSISGFDFSGKASLTYTNDVASPGWLAGEMPEASATTLVTPARATVSYQDFGYRRSLDSTSRTINTSGVISEDNIGYYTSQTWGLQRTGKGTIQSVALAVKYHDNNATKWASQYVSSVLYGISVGDVPNGGDSVPRTGCLSNYCTPVYTGGGAGLLFDDWITESCTYGCFVHVDGAFEAYSPHIETGSSALNHQIIIGAVKCDSGNAATEGRYVAWAALNGDCGSGGSGVAHASSPVVNVMFSGGGFTGSTSSHTIAAIIIGDGATQSKGLVHFGPGFRFGNEVIPANDPGCTGAATPYWYCTGVATSPQIDLMGPRFAKTSSAATVRVELANAGRLTVEFVNGGSLWPYNYYKFPDTQSVSFMCDGCDLNANDVIGRVGGFVPDGITGSDTMDTYAHNAMYPHHMFGNQHFSLIYFTKMTCEVGSWSDAGEIESVNVRAFLYDGTNAIPIGGAISFTENTDAVGVPKAVALNTNTEKFDFASGTAKDLNGVFSIGVYAVSETDSADDNLSNINCGVEFAKLGDE